MAEELHLNICLVDTINYTHHDEIIYGIMDIIKCPILLESSDLMVMFNNQLYNREAFEHHRQTESAQNTRCRSSGYNNPRLKFPRTGCNISINTFLSVFYCASFA